MQRTLLRNLGRSALVAAGKNRAVTPSINPTNIFATRQLLRSFSTPNNSEGSGKAAETTSSATEAAEEGAKSKGEVAKVDFDEYDDYYEPQTPKEKFQAYFNAFLRLSLLGLGAYCVYITGKELFPGRMNPNSLFSEVFEKLRYHEEIMDMIGEEAIAFGRDVGRNTEGRRNHVDSYKYKADDGTERMRIRMHLKGTKGKIRVWAEVMQGSKDDEFVYLIVQHMGNGRVMTITDRRDELEANIGTNSGDDSIARFFNLKK